MTLNNDDNKNRSSSWSDSDNDDDYARMQRIKAPNHVMATRFFANLVCEGQGRVQFWQLDIASQEKEIPIH